MTLGFYCLKDWGGHSRGFLLLLLLKVIRVEAMLRKAQICILVYFILYIYFFIFIQIQKRIKNNKQIAAYKQHSRVNNNYRKIRLNSRSSCCDRNFFKKNFFLFIEQKTNSTWNSLRIATIRQWGGVGERSHDWIKSLVTFLFIFASLYSTHTIRYFESLEIG